MNLSKVLVFIALLFVCSVHRHASASVLGNVQNGYKLLSKNRRVFKHSKGSEHDSPDSDTSVKRRKVWPATIKFSSFGVATLYINGIIYSKLFSPHPWSMTVNLAKGDVVAIKAEKTDNRVGVMVSIVWKGRTYRSGQHVFRVRSDSFFNWNSDEQDAWNRAIRDNNGKLKRMASFCSWKNADVVSFEKNKVDKKALFIWSLHSSHKHGVLSKTPAQTVYIRHVMGGEKCPRNSKTKNASKKKNVDDDGEEKKQNKKKTTGTSPGNDNKKIQKVEKKKSENDEQSSTDIGIGGQSETRTCKCRLVSMRGGTCFDMVTPGNDEGPCTARPCDRQYECAHDGKTMCIMRRMVTRVVMTGPHACKKISTVTDLLVPYRR